MKLYHHFDSESAYFTWGLALLSAYGPVDRCYSRGAHVHGPVEASRALGRPAVLNCSSTSTTRDWKRATQGNSPNLVQIRRAYPGLPACDMGWGNICVFHSRGVVSDHHLPCTPPCKRSRDGFLTLPHEGTGSDFGTMDSHSTVPKGFISETGSTAG